jgi:hypothetical protein
VKKQQEIGMLAFLAAVAIISFAFVWTRPIFRDYARTEYSEWMHEERNKDEAHEKFLEAQREGYRMRLYMTSPFAIGALVFSGLLIRRSRKP